MLEQVISFLSEYSGMDRKDITYDSILAVDLGLTSFDIVEMSCRLEESFNLEIPDEDMISFRKVGDISDYLTEHSPNKD
jgi:acyl carrier protein